MPAAGVHLAGGGHVAVGGLCGWRERAERRREPQGTAVRLTAS